VSYYCEFCHEDARGRNDMTWYMSAFLHEGCKDGYRKYLDEHPEAYYDCHDPTYWDVLINQCKVKDCKCSCHRH
jgi:hypothetical protein